MVLPVAPVSQVDSAEESDLPRLLKLGGAAPEEGAKCRSPSPCSSGGETCLDSPGSAAESTCGSAGEKPALRLSCGTHQIPHPAKKSYGGEDAFFASSTGLAMGVADGVSEWGWRFGVNPRGFAEELMVGAEATATVLEVGGTQTVAAGAAQSLADGHGSAVSFGAATAIVALLDPAREEVGIANLGDSGFRQFRREPGSPTVRLLAKTEEQQHGFLKPFQLSRMPIAADFPRLREEGKTALVQAVQRCGHVKQDMPSDAQLYEFPVQEGDLLLLASDGLFDNLHDSEICDLLSEKLGSGGGGELPEPGLLATAIAELAFARSQDRTADTPFGRRAREAGHQSPGGLPDDITVVLASVTRP